MEFGKRHDIADTTDFCPRQLVTDLLRTCYGETGVIDFGSAQKQIELVFSGDKNRLRCATNLELSHTYCYQSLDSIYDLTPSNVTSKLTTLPRHNTHHVHIATTPHV